MKTKRLFIVAIIAMMLVAVQGYAQPRHRGHRPPPPPRHHVYHHHPYYYSGCPGWNWYAKYGYGNRYMYYRSNINYFFDTVLGYYIYGSMEKPSSLSIGGLKMERYRNSLRIINGDAVSYLDLYTSQKASYSYQNTYIDIQTGNGVATIRFYDGRGGEVTYRL